ncbi:tetratricopeptide repeat protein [Microcoleus sp. CAWBG58]|uniref:tetratricopeptide repeat protein n=1 Tax=Microcoleus sp. CAWBG58 TaxID=2841651 RepID=UPI0025D84502|nr:tetratricopeptide repeat protein [Microcoleus sp. CAWBG58]
MSQPSATRKLDTSPEGVYRALLRCLKRTKGFGIVFVQCSPAEGNELIGRVQEDLSEKKIAVLELTGSIDNLYDIVANRGDRNDLNILFIQGLEKSLELYIKPGYGGDGDYYNLDTVPPILSHLNQRREIFRDRLSNICSVFILPTFAIKYIIRRAPDFFDWGSGVFQFSTSIYSSIRKDLEKQLLEKLQSHMQEQALYKKERSFDEKDEASSFYLDESESWIKRGNVLLEVNRCEEAIQRYELAIRLKPDSCKAWNFRGLALLQLGRYEESIASFEKALEIKPDYQDAKTNRDTAFKELN